METITKRQKEIYDFIKNYILKNNISPTIEEIKNNFNLSSVSTVHEHIESLVNKKFIKKDNHSSRSIKLINLNKRNDTIKIPLIGIITAGLPIEAIEYKERDIILSKQEIKNSYNDYYSLKVSGDSMIDDGIFDGDVVVIKKQAYADNGQTVVAIIDENKATLKKIYKEKNGFRLQPANQQMLPFFRKEVEVRGIVVKIIRNLSDEKNKKIKEDKKKKTKKNIIKLNSIYLKDLLIGIKDLPDNFFDIVIIDPPYNIGKNFGNNFDNMDIQDYISWTNKYMAECKRVLKDTGTIFIYGFSEILSYIFINIDLNKRWLVWHYTNKNMPTLNFWQRSHESIICCWKNNKIFNKDDVREPYTEGFLKNSAGKTRTGTIGRLNKTGKTTIYNANENGALPRDVIKISTLAGGSGIKERFFYCKTCNKSFNPKLLKKHLDHNIIKHPTQKPLELSEKLIKSCKPIGNFNVLVPFVGSGSECVATKKLGGSFIGFEINPDYIKIAEEFLKSV